MRLLWFTLNGRSVYLLNMLVSECGANWSLWSSLAAKKCPFFSALLLKALVTAGLTDWMADWLALPWGPCSNYYIVQEFAIRKVWQLYEIKMNSGSNFSRDQIDGTFRVKTLGGSQLYLTPVSLTVSELPEESPKISGGLQSYQVGDRLELNCTSPRTYPPTILRWFLNGREVRLPTC